VDTPEYKYKAWVYTITLNGEDIPRSVLSDLLGGCSESYAYQLEVGEQEGKEHYQGILRTPYRVRHRTLLHKFQETLSDRWPLALVHLDRMQGSWSSALAYCTKEDSRIDGPWFSDDYQEPYDGNDVSFLAQESQRFPWQNSLVKMLLSDDESSFKTPDDREIVWISDAEGCSGKSKFVKYMFIHYPGVSEVTFGTSNQLRTALISIGSKKCYFIDMPRQLGDEDSIATLISVLEKLKGGFLTSTMYGKYTSLVMDPPHIVIFSNKEPNVGMLSADRWKIFNIKYKVLHELTIDSQDGRIFVPLSDGCPKSDADL